jgi:gliding motility-associated lipoprotein GldH
MKKVGLFTLLVLICFSCDKQKVFEEFVSIDGPSWNSNNILHFNVNMADSAQAYNVLLSVRNSGKYEFSNLYLFVTAHSPNGSFIRDTVEIALADDRGKWLGKGAASMYTTYYPYRQNIRFPVRGIYTFDVEQAMWIKDLKNISDIGLRIEKSDIRPGK